MSDRRQKIILIIDPDSLIEERLQQLANASYSIHRFPTGTEGLASIMDIKPDLIISEYNTQDMDGNAIFQEFVTNPRYAKFQSIPFMLFSNLEERAVQGPKLFEMGLSGWFVKPFGSYELGEVINNLIMTREIVQKNVELQQQVKRSEYRYRDLLENANDFIFTLNDEGKFVYLNNRFTPLTGREKNEWIGQEFLYLIAPDDRENALTHYEMAHSGRARVFEARVLSLSSDSPILSFNITPIFEHGSVVGSIGIARDVTEQKQMEIEILDLKNFNESIIQSMEAGLLTTDLQGRITSLNSGAEHILEWRVDEVLGKPIKNVLKPEDADVLISNPPPPGSLPYSRETQLTIKSGKMIDIGFTATDRIDNSGQKVGTIISFRDITLLKQMQSEVIRMDRLASLGVLASGIAHEIKNPLAGIKTMAQACEEEFDDHDPRKEYLTRIVRQVNRLNDLLKTFFAYARPKPPDRNPHKLSHILREVMNLVGQKIAKSNIKYHETFETHLADVWVDSQQIQQVFLNLILNAIDAMPEGGRLSISAHNQKKPREVMDYTQDDVVSGSRLPFVEVVIKDTGTGIDPNQMEAIFDPFFTTKPTGLGLGLSIVYRIIEEHGGDIRVESHSGKGTSFKLTLPAGVIE